MLFNSYPFVFGFLPLLIAGYAIFSSSQIKYAAPIFIVIASLFFYGWWNPRYLLLFGFSIVFNFLWGRKLKPVAEMRSDTALRANRGVLAIAIAVNLALLGFFKYRNFFVDSADVALGSHWQLPPLVLPLAISFFTFEQITYLVGLYRGEVKGRDFLSYLLFITFFPHLIAGPIVRYKDIYPQFNRDSRFKLNPDNVAAGLMIFAIGLFKKVILADTLRDYVGPVFDTQMTPSLTDAWGATLAFTLQIYFDFSGYSDMAIGLARMFNVEFPENFDSPYKASSAIEFWRRWHMTLSFFLRDYLYIPLGGNRKGEARRNLNLFITMLLGGLWHGANWTFVMWGALHGVYLTVNHAWRRLKVDLPTGAAWAITFIPVVFAWVLFRAQTFARAMQILGAMLASNGLSLSEMTDSLGRHKWWRITIGLVIALIAPNRQQILAWNWDNDYVYAAVFTALAGISLLRLANPPAFIYFQF